jgi:hypothetical protein
MNISICRQCVAGGGVGVDSCWRPYSEGLLHSLYDQIQNPQYCLSMSTPRLETRRRGGLKRINSCRKVLLQIIFKTKRFCIAFYESYHSMDFYGIMAEIKDDIQIQHRYCPFMKNIDVYDKEQKHTIFYLVFVRK